MANKYFTKGDKVTLQLTALGTDGEPFDLTGYTLTSYFIGETAGVEAEVTIADADHTIAADQVANKGEFTVNLSTTQSATLKAMQNTRHRHKAVNGSNTQTFWGEGIYDVLEASLL